MNSPEEMRSHLDSSANIIHALMSASSCNKVRLFKRNVYKHPKWGFLYWLYPRGEEGPDTLYGKQNLILLYPADPPANTSKPAMPVTPPARPDTPRPTEAHAPAPLPFPLFPSTPDTHWTPGDLSQMRETQWEPQSYPGWNMSQPRMK
ncbi:hypothetical protein RhiTH_011189 [Rhizoctonia solani]